MATAGRHAVTACEHALSLAAVAGSPVDARVGDKVRDDPTAGAGWGLDRTVRAAVLYELLMAEPQPRAIVLRGARISGALNLEAATITCPVMLEGCHFDGPLNLSHARAEAIGITGCRLTCVQATQLSTRGDMKFTRSVATIIDLSGAHIGGNLVFTQASLTGGAWPPDLRGNTLQAFDELPTYSGQLKSLALVADGLDVAGDMYCELGFHAVGQVRLLGAHIHGSIALNGARLTNNAGCALNAEGITVDGDMFCQEAFVARGEVRLSGARIHGQLGFDGATLTNPSGYALNLHEAHVSTSLWLRFGGAPAGGVNLSNARLGTLYDSERSWPTKLALAGMTYDYLEAAPEVSATERLRWVQPDPEKFASQPYEQLAAFYRREGKEPDARRVAIAKQRRRRPDLAIPWRVWSLVLGATVGHGYRAWLAGVWLFALWVVGSVLFDQAYPEHFRPAKPVTETPSFQPMLYTLDLVLPFLNLHHRDAWIATGPAQLGVLLTLAGWVFASAAIASVTGLLKKD